MKREVYAQRRIGHRHRWCIRSSVWRYMLSGVPVSVFSRRG